MRHLVIIFALCCALSLGDDYSPIVGGLSGDGRTTRYWDCCKPACSWDVAFDNKNVTPAKSCAADGVTKVDKNTKSGCQDVPNADAFMCNDESAWVINDTLAYGFAAFSAAGGAELSKCCSCMMLQFQGQLLGKQMLVQVTNTGGDLYENHFDIAIPGGGVGLFNGCTKQWNAPQDGWGDRITGVADRDGCNALPEVLRAGCQFRFDFMEGVPNPDVKFYEVKCPTAITDRTGCII